MQKSLDRTFNFLTSQTSALISGDIPRGKKQAKANMSAQSYDGEKIKVDFMVKRSQMKRRLTYENYKSRWFVLTNKVLRYHDGTLEVSSF